jgi:CubicO group peptidase (beta-lactamase class C family)
VYAISRHGETQVEAISGADPVAQDSIFRIASMSKPITAVATLILLEECKIRLNDPIEEWLPELADRKVLRSIESELDDVVSARRPITVKHLLTFGLGIGIVMAPPGTYPIQRAMEDLELGQGFPRPRVAPEPEEWIKRFATLPLMAHPGERWIYHTGSDVLGVLIARVTGQPFAAFLQERIFAPLGMTGTGFWVPPDKLIRLTKSYTVDYRSGELSLFDEPATSQWGSPPAFPMGGGGMVSTADDCLAFAQMLLKLGLHGGNRLISKPSVLTMTSDQLTQPQRDGGGLIDGFWETNGFGYGVSMVTKRDAIWATPGQYGWDGGLGTMWRNDPEEELSVLLLTQRAMTSPRLPAVFSDFLTCVYQALCN